MTVSAPRTVALILAGIATLWTVSCTNTGSTSNDEPCREGRTVECPCADGRTGAQTCRADNTWGECRCEDPLGEDTEESTVDAGWSDGGGDVDRGSDGRSHSDTGPGGDAGDRDAVDTSPDGGDATDDRHPLRTVRAESRFERDVEMPNCDGSRSEVKIIDDASDWGDINDESLRIFCVRPGNYRGAEPSDDVNRLTITASGTPDERRSIVYDGPGAAHPIDRSPDERAVVDGFDFSDGAAHWTVVGLQVDPRESGGGLAQPVEVGGDASNVIFDRLLVSPPAGEFADTYAIDIWGDEITVQNSVVRNLLGNAGQDRYCISNNGQTRGVRVVSNELYDCTDGIQLAHIVDRPIFRDTIVAHNDMYITPRYYSDGDGNRGPDNSGDWTCAENAVDIKAGSDEESEPVRVIGNRMWGFSDADTDCASSGTGPRANAITIHNQGNEDGHTTRFIEVENNVIFDVESGVGVSWSDRVTVENNLLASYAYRGADEGFEANDGYGFVTYRSDRSVIRNNTFVDGKYWGSVSNGDTLRDNVFVDAGTLSGGGKDGTTAGNAYYGDSEPWESDPAIQRDAAANAEMDEFCVTLRGYTNPTRKCFSNAVPTADSPHGDRGFLPPDRE